MVMTEHLRYDLCYYYSYRIFFIVFSVLDSVVWWWCCFECRYIFLCIYFIIFLTISNWETTAEIFIWKIFSHSKVIYIEGFLLHFHFLFFFSFYSFLWKTALTSIHTAIYVSYMVQYINFYILFRFSYANAMLQNYNYMFFLYLYIYIFFFNSIQLLCNDSMEQKKTTTNVAHVSIVSLIKRHIAPNSFSVRLSIKANTQHTLYLISFFS